MKLKDVKEGELFHYTRTGYGYSMYTPLLRGKVAHTDGSFRMIRCYENIVAKAKSVLIPDSFEVEVIGRVYNKPINKRK